MCEPPSLWQDEPDAPGTSSGHNAEKEPLTRAVLESELAKQGFLQQLSDEISVALQKHAAALHEHLETLLVGQEELARNAERAFESMFRNAVASSSSCAVECLPGEVQTPDVTEITEPQDLDPPLPCEEFRVCLPLWSDGALSEIQDPLAPNCSSHKVLQAIPSLIQSSLAVQEEWHHNCILKWTSRQERRQRQAHQRLERMLHKKPDWQMGGLTRIATSDTIATPPDLSEVVQLTPTPTPKVAPEATLTERTTEHDFQASKEAPLAVEDRWVWYPAVNPPNWRRTCFLLLDDSSHSILGRIISGFMVATIMVSTVSFVIETLPFLQERPTLCQELLSAGEELTVKACEPAPLLIFSTLEAICIAIFTVEYCLRLALCHTDPRYGSSFLSRTFHYAIQPLNVVDVIAVLPFYLKLALEFSEIGVFGMLRLMRVCRLLKLAKHHQGIMVCWEALVNSGITLALLFFYEVLFGIIFATILHTLEGSKYSVAEEFTEPYMDLVTGKNMPPRYPTGVFVRRNLWDTGDEPTPFYSIPAALWWVFTTTTTVGYGDFAPTTTMGQCLGVLVFYFGIILLALPIGVVSQNFECAYERAHQGTRRRRMTSLISAKTRTMMSDARHGHVLTNRPVAPHLAPEQKGGISRWIFTVMNDPNSSIIAMGLSYISFGLIIVTTFSLILESMPVFNYTPAGCGAVELSVELCKPEPDPAFEVIEVTGSVFFTVEYALRIIFAHSASEEELGLTVVADAKPLPGWKKTLRYALQPLNVIDIMAIVPFYLEFIGLGGSGAAVLRVLRLVRIFRVLKSPKMRACVDMILCIVLEALPGIVSVFSLTCLVCIMFAACMFFAEGTTYSVDPSMVDLTTYPMGTYIRPTKDGNDWEPTPFLSIMHTFWWFFTTATTVGYGDYVPTTTAGKLVAVFTFYLGIVLVAIKLTIVQGSFRRHYPEWQKSHSI